jgi:hypothetical protein
MIYQGQPRIWRPSRTAKRYGGSRSTTFDADYLLAGVATPAASR